jgi:hypothetical protein
MTQLNPKDSHLALVRPVRPHTTTGCEDCLRMGPRHARAHAYHDGHPIVESFEPGEDWRWCYVDESYV